MLLATGVNTPIYCSVFHNLPTPVARCSASCMNGPLRTRRTNHNHWTHQKLVVCSGKWFISCSPNRDLGSKFSREALTQNCVDFRKKLRPLKFLADNRQRRESWQKLFSVLRAVDLSCSVLSTLIKNKTKTEETHTHKHTHTQSFCKKRSQISLTLAAHVRTRVSTHPQIFVIAEQRGCLSTNKQTPEPCGYPCLNLWCACV